ncbi:hypothetical protein CYLTODRAFT_426978, partial [Cylindrobasidium torrendii FP15055 ss-10]
MEHLASTLKIRETLFTTNQILSEEELKAVDSKLAQLRAEHGQLTLRLAKIEEMLSRLKYIRHPVRYVPDDILGRVFEYAAPWCFSDGIEESSFPPPYYAYKRNAPWNFAHVCQNWRAICHSLPHIWSAFRLRLSHISGPWPVFAEKMDAIYQRSSPLPLRLHIRDYESNQALRSLLKLSHRWGGVRFVSDGSDNSAHVEAFHDRLFPRLTHLALKPLSYPEPAHIMAPRLRNLELLQGVIDCGLVLPWDQITQYTSTNTDLDFIGHMKNLEGIIIKENHLSECRDYVSVNQDMERAILPKVRRFEYNNTEEIEPCYGRLDWLFIRYHFPSLRTLIISDFYCSDENFAFSLPSVVELSLVFFRADNLRNILLATPNLRSLHLRSLVCDVRSMLVNDWHPEDPSVANSLHALETLSITLGGRDNMYALPRLDKVLTALKTRDQPLKTISFYSGMLSGSERSSESEWVGCVQEKMADSLDIWTKGGTQIQYHYDVDHRFP